MNTALIFWMPRVSSKVQPTASKIPDLTMVNNGSRHSACWQVSRFQLFTRRPKIKSESSPFAKQLNIKQTSTSGKSKTDSDRLFNPATSGEPTSEHPEADVQHIVRGIVRNGLLPAPSKALVSLRVDQDVLEWFKAQGSGYQTRINAVLRAFRDASA